MIAVLIGAAIGVAQAQPEDRDLHPDIRQFFLALSEDDDEADRALDAIGERWRDGYGGMIWDLLRFLEPPPPRTPFDFGDPADEPQFQPTARESPSTRVWRRLMRFLEEQTGERFRNDMRRAQQWIWDQPYDPHPEHALFKGLWYGEIDPGMRAFFPPDVSATIRLDEIDWGGVRINGIPPLVDPARLPADEADYLEDDHVVFGIAINGDARAYPKRILAWHEMALDMVGDLDLTIVYCTLCGTVIPYESVVEGRHYRFGTSGLLYRSNKLMFDHATRSLWNTFEGIPVVGPLVGSGIRLRHRAVVTTTWGEWRRQHPETTVLSLETGHERDYREGAAYREYFATDRLMFQVPHLDDRLDNKAEVVVALLAGPDGRRTPLAIEVELLERRRLYQGTHAGQRIVVVTSEAGANRMYDAAEVTFSRLVDEDHLAGASGRRWVVTEDALVAEDDAAVRLERLPAQRAFWFGWYAQFPETELVQR